MLCNCTECNIRIPRGNPWIFGKDYLFCSSSCRYNFFDANPNLKNKPPDTYRIPEQTQPIYIPKVPSLRIICNNIEESPKEENHKENIESNDTELLNYILCNFYRKNSLNIF